MTTRASYCAPAPSGTFHGEVAANGHRVRSRAAGVELGSTVVVGPGTVVVTGSGTVVVEAGTVVVTGSGTVVVVGPGTVVVVGAGSVVVTGSGTVVVVAADSGGVGVAVAVDDSWTMLVPSASVSAVTPCANPDRERAGRCAERTEAFGDGVASDAVERPTGPLATPDGS